MTLKGTKAFTSLFYGHILTEQKAERQNWMFTVSARVVVFAPSAELHTKSRYVGATNVDGAELEGPLHVALPTSLAAWILVNF